MRISRSAVLLCLCWLISASLSAHQPASTAPAAPQSVSDPQAVALIQRALAAMTGLTQVTDVTLTGTVRRIAGSDDETGTGTLTAMSTGNSKLSLRLSSGVSSEIRNSTPSDQAAQPAGAWSGPDGVLHAMPQHNVMTDATWFFPALTVGSILSQAFQLSYLGQETHNGLSALHVAVCQTFPGLAQVPPPLQHLTQMDIFLDPTTSVPVALDFNVHPDNNAAVDIPVEIRFSSYQAINGVQVPFHVQKYLNNGLVLDLQFNNAVLNSGLTGASFQLQ
jgi:hypothetical protein